MNTESKPLPKEDDADQEASKDENATTDTNPPTSKPSARLDPTRYGDWEKDGRCIDF